MWRRSNKLGKHTIYIRESDEGKWHDIVNKPEWLHEHLSVDILKNRIGDQEVFKVNRIEVNPKSHNYETIYEPTEPTA